LPSVLRNLPITLVGSKELLPVGRLRVALLRCPDFVHGLRGTMPNFDTVTIVGTSTTSPVTVFCIIAVALVAVEPSTSWKVSCSFWGSRGSTALAIPSRARVKAPAAAMPTTPTRGLVQVLVMGLHIGR